MPNNANFNQAVARAFVQQGDLEAAEQIHREALIKNPNDATALSALFRIHLTKGDLGEAEGFINRLAAVLKPKKPLEEQAMLLTAQGKSHEALDLLLQEELEDLSDASLVARAGLGLQLRREEVFREAAEALRNRKAPSPASLLILAQHYALLQEFDELDKVLAQALAINPRHEKLVELKLQNDYRKGRLGEAEKGLLFLLSINQNNGFANLRLGIERYKAGRKKEAEALWRRGLKSGRNPELLNSLAYLLMELDKAEEGKKLIDEVIATWPEVDRYQHTKGVIYLRLGDLETAEATLRKALALRADHAEALLDLADCFHQQNKIEEARRLIAQLDQQVNELPLSRQRDLRLLKDRMRTRPNQLE